MQPRKKEQPFDVKYITLEGSPPSSWDWRENNMSLEVFHQRRQEGGWAYAAANAITSHWLAKYKDFESVRSFSPQMLLECVESPDPTANDAFDYIKDTESFTFCNSF